MQLRIWATQDKFGHASQNRTVVHFKTCGSHGDSVTCKYGSNGTFYNFTYPASFSAGVWTCWDWTPGSLSYIVQIIRNKVVDTTREPLALALNPERCA